jgi:hypothetical protein
LPGGRFPFREIHLLSAAGKPKAPRKLKHTGRAKNAEQKSFSPGVGTQGGLKG